MLSLLSSCNLITDGNDENTPHCVVEMRRSLGSIILAIIPSKQYLGDACGAFLRLLMKCHQVRSKLGLTTSHLLLVFSSFLHRYLSQTAMLLIAFLITPPTFSQHVFLSRLGKLFDGKQWGKKPCHCFVG